MYTCRFCLVDELVSDGMFRPCQCRGSVEWVHRQCLATYRQTVGSRHRGYDACTLCGARYQYAETTVCSFLGWWEWCIVVAAGVVTACLCFFGWPTQLNEGARVTVMALDILLTMVIAGCRSRHRGSGAIQEWQEELV